MTSYATFRIAETIRVLLFMTLSILVFDVYPVTAIMIVLLAVLNDFPIMMIAYDNATVAPRPLRWNMRRVLTVASVIGLMGVAETFLLFWFVDRVLAVIGVGLTISAIARTPQLREPRRRISADRNPAIATATRCHRPPAFKQDPSMGTGNSSRGTVASFRLWSLHGEHGSG